MNRMLQTLLYIGLAALIYLLLTMVASATKPTQPVGIVLPAFETFAATSAEQVEVLTEMPFSYNALGKVSMMSPYEGEDVAYQRLSELVQAAREKAASVGANALIIDQYGYTPQEGLGVYALEARALYNESPNQS